MIGAYPKYVMTTRAHTVPRFYLSGFTCATANQNCEPYLYLGSVETGSIKRRAPGNVSIARGFYDGPGGLAERDATIEIHLAKIERAAAMAISQLRQASFTDVPEIPPEIWRFVAWQAARTPAWIAIVEELINEWNPNEKVRLAEPPFSGVVNIKDSSRLITIQHKETGDQRTATFKEYKTMFEHSWRWKPCMDDRLEMIHMQAWYFQARHFPRLHWRIIAPPDGLEFITSDRGVTWSAAGNYQAPPSALRHESAEVLAPLTARLALIGRISEPSGPISAEEFNARVAMSAGEWIAGASEVSVTEALHARSTRLLTGGAAMKG